MNDLLSKEYSVFKKRDLFIQFHLTKRECEIVFLITKGYRNRTIGDVLYISEATVKKHVYNIFNKTGVCSRFELLCKFVKASTPIYIETAC